MSTIANPICRPLCCAKGSPPTAEGQHDIHHEFSQYTMGYSQPFTVLTIWRGTIAARRTVQREDRDRRP